MGSFSNKITMKTPNTTPTPTTPRREFLRTSAVLAATAALAPLALERSAHAAGSDIIRIGLIGYGGRGTEAALNAMNAGKDIRLVALADIFEERLMACRSKAFSTLRRGACRLIHHRHNDTLS